MFGQHFIVSIVGGQRSRMSQLNIDNQLKQHIS